MKAEVGKPYMHYKGERYVVDSISTHTETGEVFINYCGAWDYLRKKSFVPKMWSRPIEMFEEEVEVRGKMTHRFTLL